MDITNLKDGLRYAGGIISDEPATGYSHNLGLASELSWIQTKIELINVNTEMLDEMSPRKNDSLDLDTEIIVAAMDHITPFP
ncbi:hypothetical protein DKX38_003091 [Salix brachista]|uniref:Uncharacterized protein n=1 Tax=Salix brachista TaxID=2182728 RepID=A0A5N5NQR7_9ROSI|nr:hypothetical protein DKX38_003091 [Salix brachista]